MKHRLPVGYINKQQAAEVLGLCQRAIDYRMRRRMIPYRKDGRRVLFKRDEILASIDAKKIEEINPLPEQKETMYHSGVWLDICNALRSIVKYCPDDKEKNLARSTLVFLDKFDVL